MEYKVEMGSMRLRQNARILPLNKIIETIKIRALMIFV